MRFNLRTSVLCSVIILSAFASVFGKPPTMSQVKMELKKVTEERDELKNRLHDTENLQEELADVKKSREVARQELEDCRRELDQIKGSFLENQQSSDLILKDLQTAKENETAAKAEVEKLKKDLEEAKEKLKGKINEGTLIAVTPDIIPAKPINLYRVTPKVKKVDRGVVVVNVLISENGEVLATSLLQGMQGEGEWVQKANEACVEAAKRLVFDPARTVSGKIKVRVWQGVGFLLD